MFSWFRRRPVALPVAAPVPDRPEWVDELSEALQKQARAAAKQSARVEATLGELAATLGEIDGRIARLGAALMPPRAASANEDSFEQVFDALDALDAALVLAHDPHFAEGLVRVGERLERFCEQRGYRRLTALGSAPNGDVMRVVGTEPSEKIPPGCVLRVVRAAIVRGDQLVRQGSVIVSAVEAEHGQRVGN